MKKQVKLTGNMVSSDNFGDYDGSDEVSREFHRQVNNGSVLKTCRMCYEKVRLLPHYDKCNSCMDQMERGHEW